MGRRWLVGVTPERICEVFKGLEDDDCATIFNHIVCNGDWTVMGE
jgi:hypothetical protein